MKGSSSAHLKEEQVKRWPDYSSQGHKGHSYESDGDWLVSILAEDLAGRNTPKDRAQLNVKKKRVQLHVDQMQKWLAAGEESGFLELFRKKEAIIFPVSKITPAWKNLPSDSQSLILEEWLGDENGLWKLNTMRNYIGRPVAFSIYVVLISREQNQSWEWAPLCHPPALSAALDTAFHSLLEVCPFLGPRIPPSWSFFLLVPPFQPSLLGG